MLQSHFKKKEWQKKYPHWGAFRKHQVDIFKQTDYLNAIIFVHSNDNFEDPETLSFFKEFKGMQFIDYSEINPATCNWADVDKKMPSNKGHYIPQSSCVTKYINDNNYLIIYLKKIFLFNNFHYDFSYSFSGRTVQKNEG